jgi:hypothetical protein
MGCTFLPYPVTFRMLERASPWTRPLTMESERWVIERTFAWLGKSRRLARDYEFLPQSSVAMVYVVVMPLMLKRLDKLLRAGTGPTRCARTTQALPAPDQRARRNRVQLSVETLCQPGPGKVLAWIVEHQVAQGAPQQSMPRWQSGMTLNPVLGLSERNGALMGSISCGGRRS